MAITDTTKITGAINKQGNSTLPGLGCGSVLIGKLQDLPPGDYVAVQLTDPNADLTLSNITWKGEPMVDKDGVIVTGLNFSPKMGTTIFYANIESATVDSAQLTIFYKRCK